MKLYNFIEKVDAFPIIMPSNLHKERVMPMSTMEVLTLLLVIFAALSYIDKRNKKK